MRKPLIGINCRLRKEGKDLFYRLDRLYVKAVEKSGAIPVLLPFFSQTKDAATFVQRLDGLLLTGGTDPHSKRWREPLHRKAELLQPEKEESDFRLVRAALRQDLPILGICYGAQLVNISLGGSLHQHLPDLPSVGAHENGCRHDVEILGPSRIHDLVGSRRRVNSYHHQAVNRVGKGLKVTAYSPDGVIEGLESERHRWVVCLQWHPERMMDRPEQRRVFRSFSVACR